MGKCQICNCINEENEKNQVLFPLFQNISFLNKELSLSKINLKGKNNNMIHSYGTNTIEQMRLTNEQKKQFETVVRNSNTIPKDRQDNSFLKEESRISITNSLFINELRDNPTKNYIKLKKIGTGSYGTVYLARNKYNDELVAIKEIPKTSEDLLSDGEIMDEINILKKLDHPDIVRILEFYNTEEKYYIINEYIPGGELFEQINNIFSETQIAVMFRQILSGLAYLHSNNIIHRDLKLENILINEVETINGEKYFILKIIDFGTARIFDKNKKAKAIVGSTYYIAPEVLNKKYNRECDLWSAGIILYMFIVGSPPFDAKSDKEIMDKIKKGKFPTNSQRWKNASNEVKDLIQKLLVYEPEKRLTALQALRHPWFGVTNSNILYNNISKREVLKCVRNLLNYHIKSKFEELVLAYIVHNIPRPKEAKSSIKLFKLANKNDDGKLLRNELKETLLNFVSEEFLSNYDDIFSMLDGDNNGYIDYEEFLRATLNRKHLINEDVLNFAFKFFDKENTGYIKRDEIKSYFIGTKMSEELFSNIFNEIDTNKDGKIDLIEFKNMMLY